MSKSERRNFSLMAQKTGRSSVLYWQLFQLICKDKTWNEKNILKKIPTIKKSQLANLRANLYKQVLRSLRDIHKESYLEIKAREHFDFAKILYTKGMYRASLNMLQKTKALARKINKEPLAYLAISFEKHIESQHVTGSMFTKAEQLNEESKDVLDSLKITDALSNLALLMYGKYLQVGTLRDEEEKESIDLFFEQHLPKYLPNQLDFHQQMYLYQAHIWYYTMIRDFAKYYGFARRWVDLFEEYPEMKQIETVSYIKAMHNVLNALYMSDKAKRFEEELKHFIKFYDGSPTLSINELNQFELFKNIHILNLIFFKANYKESVDKADELTKSISNNPEKWDINRRIVFHYKLACVYFGANELDKAIGQLGYITNRQISGLKEDIQCFARILKLIAHYDMGDEDLVSYDVRSVYRFLLGMKELQAVQKEILKFIRKTPTILPRYINDEFAALRERLIPLEQDMLERRPFLYLDIISWLDSKILKLSMAEAIRLRRGLN